LQVRVINYERAVGRQADGPVDCLQTLFEKRVVVIDAPPALSIAGIGDIELCARISLGRIGAGPLVSRRAKLFATKECQPVINLS